MNEYKEFHGKSLDDAIAEACGYYGTEREKLEIEIVNDAKTGIFGLVGAKKACIRACRSKVASSIIATLEAKEEPAKAPAPSKAKAPKVDKVAKAEETAPTEAAKPQEVVIPQEAAPAPRAAKKAAPKEPSPAPQAAEETKPSVSAQDRAPRNLDAPQPVATPTAAVPETAAPQPKAPARQPRVSKPRVQKAQQTNTELSDAQDDLMRDEVPELALNICSEEVVSAAVLEAITKLITPIVGEAGVEIAIADGRIRVSIDCGEASGILVGREGQTLASIQYLVARLVAKRLGGAIRLQIDVGNYRERQDDRLKELALYLAEKAKKTKRTQATRPLSAYQRRIIHLVLEEDEGIQTHSKGDGPHRRVVIQLKRGAGERQQNTVSQDEELVEEHAEA